MITTNSVESTALAGIYPFIENESEDIPPPPDNQSYYVYGPDWIVLQNDLVYSSNNLSIYDKRLMQMLSPLVRQDLEINPDKKDRVFIIHAKEYTEYFGKHIKGSYNAIIRVANEFKDKYFQKWDFSLNKPVGEKKPWYKSVVHSAKTGSVAITLSDEAIEHLHLFNKDKPYTKYKKNLINSLSAHGMRLFEILVVAAFRKTKQVTYTVEYLRDKFGCLDKYKAYAQFRKIAIDAAVNNLREAGIYDVHIHETKFSRNIVEVTFTFSPISPVHPAGYNPEDNDPSLVDVAFKGVSVPLPERIQREILDMYRDKPKELEFSVKAANAYLSRSHAIGKNIENKLGVYISALRENWGADLLKAEEEEKRLERERKRQQRERERLEAERIEAEKREFKKYLDVFNQQPNFVKDVVLDRIAESLPQTFIKDKFTISRDVIKQSGQDQYSIVAVPDFSSYFVKVMKEEPLD